MSHALIAKETFGRGKSGCEARREQIGKEEAMTSFTQGANREKRKRLLGEKRKPSVVQD